VVLYHGRRRWSAPLRVEEYFGPLVEGGEKEQWLELVLRFGPVLDDLMREGEEELLRRRGAAVVRLVWLLFRYGRSGELAGRLPRWQGLFTEVYRAPGGERDMRAIVKYLLWVGNQEVHRALKRVLHCVVQTRGAEELMRSVGEELIAKGLKLGRAEGKAEGKAEGRAEDVLRILAARGVRVDARTRRRILGCMDLPTLDRWFDRALRATRLSELFLEQ
jgi:hypothetical protein